MKSFYILALALAVIGLVTPVFGEEKVTVRISTTAWIPMGCQSTTGNPSCGFWSADDPTRIVSVFLTPGTDCTAFADPVPPGGKAVSIDLKFSHGPASIPFVANIYINPTEPLDQSYLIGTEAVGTWPASEYECDASRPTASIAMLEGPKKAGGIPHYHYGDLNLIYADPGWAGFGWEYVEVTVHYEPPRVAQFDVTNETPELQRRMVIHNSRSDYPYPSVNQVQTSVTERPQYTIAGRVTSGGHGVETDLWLRVLDPEDPSLYLPSDMQHDNDNMDSKPRGTLIPISCASTPCAPSDALQVHTNADGAFSVRLEGTDRYAGDNYLIEAGEDAEFSCSTGGPGRSNICARSGIITAWKRIFVEKQKMLRNGISLTADAHSGDTSIRVADNRYRGNQGHHRISKGDRIVLVHGPALDRSDLARGSYYEEHTVESVAHDTNDYVVNLGTKTGNLVTAEHLAHDFGRDPSNQPFLADSIAALLGTNLSPADCFDAADNLFTNVFAEAFTEYVILPHPPSGFVPAPNFGSTNESDLQRFADKWSSSVGTDGHAPANHQLLLIADDCRSNAADAAGVTVTHVPGESSSWVWRGTIETQVATHGAVNEGQDPNLWAAKNAAHELAHQWKTDTIFNLVDHCPATTKTYNDSSLYCLLATNSSGGAETQRANGVARFHLLPLPGGGWHSEYFEIRRNPDPFVP